MVDIFVFCTDIEVVFSGYIARYKEAIQEIFRILGTTLNEGTIQRLAKVEFKFMPKWLHRRVRRVVLDMWRNSYSPHIVTSLERRW